MEEGDFEEPEAWLEFERDSEDFGEVYQAATRSTTFRMTAAGTEPLVMHELRRTCGCTEGELYVLGADGSRELFAPGEPYAPGTEFESMKIVALLFGSITTLFLESMKIRLWHFQTVSATSKTYGLNS